MSNYFRALNRIAGQKQRATMAHQPQANGTAKRMVQTLTRALKMYVTDVDQKGWDKYWERLTFALNTAQDRVRGNTTFMWYMVGIHDLLLKQRCPLKDCTRHATYNNA